MSAIVSSSIKRFIEISLKLEELGIQNIHLDNSTNSDSLNTPMISLVFE